jgi:hypothetical protein
MVAAVEEFLNASLGNELLAVHVKEEDEVNHLLYLESNKPASCKKKTNNKFYKQITSLSTTN